MLWYNNHRDVYIVNIMIRLRLVLYIVRVKRWLSLMMLMMMAPVVGRYLKMLNGVIGRININESIKKLVTLVCVLLLGGLVLELRYIIAFLYFSGRVVGAVVLRVYVFVLMGVGMWIVIVSYTALGGFVSDNYKLLGVGILPLMVFFVKICGNILIM